MSTGLYISIGAITCFIIVYGVIGVLLYVYRDEIKKQLQGATTSYVVVENEIVKANPKETKKMTVEQAAKYARESDYAAFARKSADKDEDEVATVFFATFFVPVPLFTTWLFEGGTYTPHKGQVLNSPEAEKLELTVEDAIKHARAKQYIGFVRLSTIADDTKVATSFRSKYTVEKSGMKTWVRRQMF